MMTGLIIGAVVGALVGWIGFERDWPALKTVLVANAISLPTIILVVLTRMA